MSNGEWVGVDLDGTLAHCDGWKGMEHIGEPIQPMIARVNAWVSEGVTVKIFTAPILVILEYGLFIITPISDVIHSSGIFNAQWS